VSFVLIRIDPKTGAIFFTGAGHEHLIIYRAKTHTCEKVKAGGVVLGLSADLSGRLEEKELNIEKGDMVVLYTDGATEATDSEGEEFGINRVGQIVLNFGKKSPDEVVHAIFETVTRFHGRDAEQEDDLTIVAFRKT
jgi:phosphoserine phosphatase RsbU/P